MPEGDAIRRLATTFEELFVGHVCEVTSPQGRFAASAALLDGMRLERVRAVGKHMFMGFVPPEAAGQWPDQWVHIHLGLYGWWRFNGDATVVDHGHGVVERLREGATRPGPRVTHVPMRWGAGSPSSWLDDWDEAREAGAAPVWEAPEPVGQVRMRLLVAHAVADLVGPNRCVLITDEERRAQEARLGPDPLAPGARDDVEARERFVAAVRRSRRAIGELVMDQSVIAGVGNIYRADVLFLAGISPMRRGDRVSEARLRALWVLVCDVMNRALSLGRLDTMDPDEAPAEPIPGDEEASRWYVYHRTGRPCLRCGTPVAEKEMQGRRLFWCPSCQR